ncbi:MAG TPA: putative phage abortive infection protein [Flavobacterium sp.]|nr:putative phage abortive infection protein [Flavobacterium sp.]
MMALVAIIFSAIILVSIILGRGLFFKTYSKLLIAALILLLSFLVLLFFTTIHSIDVLDNAKDYGEIGPYGDYIGGILNPLIAVFAVFAAGFAFYAQYEANKQVQDQFKIQQFESQFFEMLRLHKENVNEMRITGYEVLIETSNERDTNGGLKSITETYTNTVRMTEGRKVFVTMNTELIACYEFLELYNNSWGTNIPQPHLLDLAYKFFFFGSKSEIVSSSYINKSIIDNFRHELNQIRNFHKNSSGVKNTFTGINNKTIKLYIKYFPFSGHENRLGHYYRHLYSTVKYVVNKEKKGLIDYKQSREYLKILRSQMSNDEQLMLYYNYKIGFGKDWENEGYLTKYRMLHNLPIDQVKYAENPRTHFQDFINSIKADEGALFEWGDYD